MDILKFGDYVFEEDLFSEEILKEEKTNMWLKSPEGIFPSHDSEIIKSVPSGLYRVLFNNDSGYYIKKQSIQTDELYVFSDSKIPKLLEEISSFWNKKELFKQYKYIHKMGILLAGEPGNGKSSLITLLANEIIKRNGIMFIVNCTQEFNYYFNFIKYYFRKVEPNREIILVIEGLEKLDGGELLLDLLDGKSSIQHHLVIATTNDTTDMEESLLRPGRFDKQVYISSPNDVVRGEYFKNKGISEEELDKFVKVSEGFTFAALKNLLFSVKLIGCTLEDTVEYLEDSGEKVNYNENLNKKTSVRF